MGVFQITAKQWHKVNCKTQFYKYLGNSIIFLREINFANLRVFVEKIPVRKNFSSFTTVLVRMHAHKSKIFFKYTKKIRVFFSGQVGFVTQFEKNFTTRKFHTRQSLSSVS